MFSSIISSRLKKLQRDAKKKCKRWRAWLRKRVWWRRVIYFSLGAAIALVILPGLMYGLFLNQYRNKVMPGVVVVDVPISGMTREKLIATLEQMVDEYERQWPVVVAHEQQEWVLPHDPITLDVDEVVDAAMAVGRGGDMVTNAKVQFEVWQQSERLPMAVKIDESWLNDLTATMAGVLDVPAVPHEIEVLPYPDPVSESRITVNPGIDGLVLNQEAFMTEFADNIQWLKVPNNDLPMRVVGVGVTNEQIDEAVAAAEGLLDKELAVSYESDGVSKEWTLSDEEMIGLIDFETGYSQELVEAYVMEVAAVVDRPAQDAKFQFDKQANKVGEFLPAKDGLEVSTEETAERLIRAIGQLEDRDELEAVELVVVRTSPEVTLIDVNNLGIVELLGRGESTYWGSIPTRVHNVGLAAARITGTLVKPGEEFSFNGSVGEVDATTGYQSAYVIRNGRTELGDGGGVCQDSTTTFRAALDAGLPITERRAHSYRVGYYEQNAKAGLDATVFSPTTDLKFLNDTPAHLLIQAEADEANRTLVIEIYGTSDGRRSEISNHVVWDITPPPPDVFQDDPTLPEGELKQVDWKAAGAKAKFDYSVERDGEVIYEKTFYSNFKPWAAVYLRGTGGV